MSDFNKQNNLRKKNDLKQSVDRLKRGVGAIRKDPLKKGGAIVFYFAVLVLLWTHRHEVLGYSSGDPLAPLNDLLAGLVAGTSALAVPTALTWAWGGPIGAGKVQDNLMRAGVVNAIGEAPTLISKDKDNQNPNIITYTFRSCGISLAAWMDSTDKIQTALNRTIADIRYGADHQHIQIATVPPTTILPNYITYHNRLLPCEQTVLLLGRSALGAVTIDLRTIPHHFEGAAAPMRSARHGGIRGRLQGGRGLRRVVGRPLRRDRQPERPGTDAGEILRRAGTA